MPEGRTGDVVEQYEELSLETSARGEGIGVVDPRRRLTYLDARARELLDGRLALDELVPELLLSSETVVSGDEDHPALELRPRSASVDGGRGWLLVIADVSDRRSPEEQLTALLAFAAHELRTPITAVAGYASTILEHGERLAPGVVTEFVTIIERQARRLSRMTTMLLSVAKGSADAEPDVIVVATAVGEVLDLLDPLGCEVSVEGDLHAAVVCDPTHLQEVLTNLVSNAGKYGEPPVIVRIEDGAASVDVSVIDHGRGVPEGFVHRMWDLFARARADERPAGVDGAGLGLGLVRSMVEANRGSIAYRPNGSAGSIFTMTLPRG